MKLMTPLTLFLSLGIVILFLAAGTLSRTSLPMKRIRSELREIANQGLSLDVPFNTSLDEVLIGVVFSSCPRSDVLSASLSSTLRIQCGVRLSPLSNNLLEWHFSFTGMEGSPFEGGVYHGRIKLPKDYPNKAPAICVSTPSGRWAVNNDICLSASAHHPETWNPHWNLRTLVLSLRGFMTTKPQEIGSISASAVQQRALAKISKSYSCPCCFSSHHHLLHQPVPGEVLDPFNHKMLSKQAQGALRFALVRSNAVGAGVGSAGLGGVRAGGVGVGGKRLSWRGEKSTKRSLALFGRVLLYSLSFLLLVLLRNVSSLHTATYEPQLS
jgi:ubiquitin-protein ligase